MTTEAVTSAEEVAVDIDAALLFIGSLVELPAFAGKSEALHRLADAVRQGRDAWTEQHGITEEEVDGGDLLQTPLGLWTHDSGFLVDPGFGRDMTLVFEKVRQLAEDVIGVSWSDEKGCWVSITTGVECPTTRYC